MNMKRCLPAFVVLALIVLSPSLMAHPNHLGSDFNGGVLHPLTGLDHVLAMVAVGLWAAQLGGRARWLVPMAFVSLMSLGGVLGFAGIPVPWVESGILASVLVLGLLIAAAARLPLVTSMALVGMFAIFHGHAHGAEMGASVSAITYSLGLVLATALLHVVGIGLGMGFKKIAGEKLVRVSGAAIAMGAVCLWAGRF